LKNLHQLVDRNRSQGATKPPLELTFQDSKVAICTQLLVLDLARDNRPNMLPDDTEHEVHREIVFHGEYRDPDLILLLELLINLFAYRRKVVIREEIPLVGVDLREPLTHSINMLFNPLHSDVEVLRELNHVEAPMKGDHVADLLL